MEPQQSTYYAQYMLSLKWEVVQADGVQIFLRKFPILGGIVKIHRPLHLPNINKLIPILRSKKIKSLIIEPIASQNQKKLDLWCRTISKHVYVSTTPYLPTKTFRIDLTRPEEEIFKSFSEAKRRAVRRSTKLGIVIKESDSIKDLVRIKNKSGGFFGFITTTGIDKFWPIFAPAHAAILLAYSTTHQNELVGGVLLLLWDGVAYYWIAGAVKKGKKLFAPTLLVWEAVKLAKQRGCKIFDFVGVWDERLPKENKEWLGFTKFKEGFSGETLYYPLVPRSG
jgi:lipid II:glycine glycyltransferase (peptidoglycan interpeptide bridge formation enzyme)